MTTPNADYISTVGYLYTTFFDSANPFRNLINHDAGDDDPSNTFRISNILKSGQTYILVVSTFDTFGAGRYSITVTGTGRANMSSLTSETSKSIDIYTFNILTNIETK